MKVKAGEIGVDAGLCWIGDPCYIHPDGGKRELPKEFGKTWSEFCSRLHAKERDHGGGPTMEQFNYDMGHPGLGVCVSTGFGDGVYPVYAEIVDEGPMGKRIKSITVEFLEEDDGIGRNECTDSEMER